MAGETPQMKTALEQGSRLQVVGEWPFYDGVPMVKVSCAAAELIPSVQYGNVTVGPVQVTFFATANGEVLCNKEGLRQAILFGQEVCESAVAEERQTVHTLMRASASRGQ